MSYHKTPLTGEALTVSPSRCTAAEPSVLHQHRLWSSGGLSVYSNQWRRDRNPVRFEDVNYHPVLALPRLGSYVRLIRGQTQVVDANTASFCDADVPFAIDHRETVETDVTVIGMDRDLIETVGRDSRGTAPVVRPGVASLSLPLSPRGALLHRLLVRELCTQPRADDLTLFESVSALLRCALSAGGESREGTAGRIPAAAGERVTAVRLLLSRSYCEPLTLDCISQVAGCSLWNLSREFTALVGRPIHKYLVRLRLRHVLQEVLDGADDLTAVALRAGFSSHSHMTAAFRREFGRTPSSLRAERGRVLLRELVLETDRIDQAPSYN